MAAAIDYDFAGLQVQTSVACQTALRAKMLDDDIHMLVVQPFLQKVAVRLAHILSGVGVRPAKHHGQKGLLLGELSVHIGIMKEMPHAIILQHLSIKRFDGSIDRGGPA